MANAVGVMEHAWLAPYHDGKLGERMQFGALGSTVHGPEVTVNFSVFGGGGGGGDGDGGGGGDGGDGVEHTRQPRAV
jgi:hypothetical protein